MKIHWEVKKNISNTMLFPQILLLYLCLSRFYTLDLRQSCTFLSTATNNMKVEVLTSALESNVKHVKKKYVHAHIPYIAYSAEHIRGSRHVTAQL